MKSQWKRFCLLIVMLMVVQSALFTVPQGSRAMVSRLGNLHYSKGKLKLYAAGLHVKIPLIDKVIVMDARLQNIDVPSSRVLTEEQKSVDVDYFVKWRISNFELYFTRTAGDILLAKNLLTRKVNDLLRAQFGDKMLVEVISNNRHDLMKVITDVANTSAQDIGVDVVDVRIKSIDYPKEVTLSVYQRMKTQREQVAKMYRANGHMRGAEIQAEADKEANMIKVNASMEAAFVRAKGDEAAALIANKAYGENPKFYKFWRTMQVYQNSLDGKTILMLDPKAEGGLAAFLSTNPDHA